MKKCILLLLIAIPQWLMAQESLGLFYVALKGGLSIREKAEVLGTALKLPPWLEGRREYIEDRLPPLQLPAIGAPT